MSVYFFDLTTLQHDLYKVNMVFLKLKNLVHFFYRAFDVEF